MNSRFSLFSVVIQSFIIWLWPFSFCGRLAIQDTRPDRFYKQIEIFELVGTWIIFLQFILSNEEFTIFTPVLQSAKEKSCMKKKLNQHSPWSCESCRRIKGIGDVGLGGTVVIAGAWEADAEITAEAGMCAISWSILGLVGSSTKVICHILTLNELIKCSN